MAPPPPPQELNPDAISEILLRLPPDDPAGLVRASAVCKPWLRTLTDPAFLRRYRAFHGTPRVLGFLDNRRDELFVPTTAFRPHAATPANRTYVLDCRHGRVLFSASRCNEFVVWDPVTGRERRIPAEPSDGYTYTNHAVLCAAGTGCDHSTCSGGPFLLACAGTCTDCWALSYARFYSSETGAWSEQTSLSRTYYLSLDDRPAAFAWGALYFLVGFEQLLRYDVLGGQSLMFMDLPLGSYYHNAIVMTAGNGDLGLAHFDEVDGMLHLWSAEMDPDGDARWSHTKQINLQELLPIDIYMSSARLSGFAEGASLIFLSTDDSGIFTIDLKSLLARKVCEMDVDHDNVFPYVSFYTPAAFARGTLQSPVETQRSSKIHHFVVLMLHCVQQLYKSNVLQS